jgi:hypothetical protein
LKTKKVFLIKLAPHGQNQSIAFSSNFIPSADDLKEILRDIQQKVSYPKALVDACVAGINTWGVPKECKDEIVRHWKYPGEYSSKGYLAIKVVDIYFK